ncbi:MAG TPA: class I SAM-dependent methyltransferase [Candidatus Moranbacteria bacterium]|nr:class I SAM-dependent methyltransferase [Candidatus Moranbacteria bacterium]HRZ33937.1 class I SAM-dependent methyltransferase [Candidatus Moranbacteria bacterium]
MDQKIKEKILKETEHGYNSMAEKFSETRKYFWRGLEFIADYAKEGEKVLDFGCGNGRLLELFFNKKIDYLGIDISEKLINTAKEKYPNKANNFQKISNSDSLSLPSESFNIIFSIAVFHHFPSKKYREDVAKELYRIIKKEGYIIITTWNLWQKKYIKNIFKNWLGKLKGDRNMDWNDCYVSFTDNEGKKFQRYHHAFTKRELRKLFSDAGFKVEKCEIIDKRNILLIGKK